MSSAHMIMLLYILPRDVASLNNFFKFNMMSAHAGLKSKFNLWLDGRCRRATFVFVYQHISHHIPSEASDALETSLESFSCWDFNKTTGPCKKQERCRSLQRHLRSLMSTMKNVNHAREFEEKWKCCHGEYFNWGNYWLGFFFRHILAPRIAFHVNIGTRWRAFEKLFNFNKSSGIFLLFSLCKWKMKSYQFFNFLYLFARWHEWIIVVHHENWIFFQIFLSREKLSYGKLLENVSTPPRRRWAHRLTFFSFRERFDCRASQFCWEMKNYPSVLHLIEDQTNFCDESTWILLWLTLISFNDSLYFQLSNAKCFYYILFYPIRRFTMTKVVDSSLCVGLDQSKRNWTKFNRFQPSNMKRFESPGVAEGRLYWA